MLKENINIDDSYTDRVVRQLVDETEIDFKAGKVHLPATDYSWTFDHFGPGGLENALRMTASNSFGTHIINNYGIDEEEFEVVLTKFIEVIAEKINRYLDPIFNLQENKNIDWDYTDRVVKQLVDETEIDFKNSRVKLDAAEFSFPFYSFGSRRAHRENIIFEPNSKFGKHVISNYGVDETEYKEIYAMYMGIIASRLQDHDENINHLHLHESRTYGYLFHEDNFLDKIVEQLLAETKVFNDRGQLRAIPPFFENEGTFTELGDSKGISLAELIDSTPNDTIFVDFKYYCKQMYGLTFEECYYVWREYRSGLYQTDFSHLYTPNIHLDESSLTPSYRESDEVPSTLARIVYQLVNETIIEDDEYGIPVAYPSWITDEGFGEEGVALDILLDSDKKSVNFTEFHYYVNNMYGLDEDEINYVWSSYKGWLWEKEQQNVYAYQKSLEDEELNESKKDLNSYVHTVVDKMVDSTHLEYKKTTNTIWVKLPFHIMLNNPKFSKGKNIEEVSSTYITSPTARVVAEIRKHLILIYGMDKWETDQAALMYLSKMADKITDYKYKGFDDNWNELNESEDKKENHLDKIVDHLINGTNFKYSHRGYYVDPTQFTNKERESLDSYIDAPFLDGIYLSSHILHSASSYHSFVDFSKEVFGLTEDEMGYIWEKYEMSLIEILHNKLNKSVDLSYTDDKDFPFLNKLANHTMSVTEIGRNAVLFPFIDGYISDGNFHKYFHGTPYDQLPFEATLKLDEYLREFGLTENEKERWWDIYVIKVIDAVNERDLRIIDNYGELNEQTFVDDINDPIYEKIANSIANESEIVISPSPYNKMFLRSPAWRVAPHIENVIDQLTGRIKDVVPDQFVKHLKEIYNIKYPTFVQKVWELYRDKMMERIKIKQAQQRQIPPKQQKFFDHILKTLVDETEVQTMKDWLPDDETYEQRVWVTPPFINHGQSDPAFHDDSIEWNDFSFFGSGWQGYMHDVYGLNDNEIKKLWSPYYKALEKKVDELIERDRIIYGDD